MSKEIKKKSRKRELEIAKDVGGKRHTGSGSLWWKKSDASDPNFQYEDKFTGKLYFSVNRATLDKIEKEALGDFKIPVLRFGFIDAQGINNFAVLRAKDCCCYSSCRSIITEKQSHRIKLDILQKYYKESDDSVLCLLSLAEKEYYVLTWDYFLDVKDKILYGGSI